MKRRFLIKYNHFLAFLLSLLGLGAACTIGSCEYGSPMVEYGTPTAHFRVFGTVESDDGTQIPDIRVVMDYDTSFTGVHGDYEIQAAAFPDDQVFTVKFEDVDGSENGSFQAKDSLVRFENPEFENGDDSWYSGETSKEVNIRLKTDE